MFYATSIDRRKTKEHKRLDSEANLAGNSKHWTVVAAAEVEKGRARCRCPRSGMLCIEPETARISSRGTRSTRSRGEHPFGAFYHAPVCSGYFSSFFFILINGGVMMIFKKNVVYSIYANLAILRPNIKRTKEYIMCYVSKGAERQIRATTGVSRLSVHCIRADSRYRNCTVWSEQLHESSTAMIALKLILSPM